MVHKPRPVCRENIIDRHLDRPTDRHLGSWGNTRGRSSRKPQVSIKSQSWENIFSKISENFRGQTDRQTDRVTYTSRWSRLKIYFSYWTDSKKYSKTGTSMSWLIELKLCMCWSYDLKAIKMKRAKDSKMVTQKWPTLMYRSVTGDFGRWAHFVKNSETQKKVKISISS